MNRASYSWIFSFAMIVCLAGIVFLMTLNTTGVQKMILTSEMGIKTVCVGRFLIDIPSDLQVSFGQTHVAGWRISSIEHLDDEQFKAKVAHRENLLHLEKNRQGQPSLELAIPVNYPHATGEIFMFDRSSGDYFKNGKRIIFENVSIEALVHLDGATLLFEDRNARPDDVGKLKKLLEQVSSRTSDEMPDKPGFCIEDAFIRDPITTDYTEFSVMFAGYPSRPDVAIAFSTAAHATVTKSLLQRNSENDVAQRFASRFRSVYKGYREINGIKGEEVSDRVMEKNGARVHSYMWESYTVKGDPLQPSIVIELSTGHGRAGEPVKSSLTDKEVQVLWDQLSGSIRIRPNSAEKLQEEVLEPIARAQAGSKCPTSGWWSCIDDTAEYEVMGGARQFFQAGVKMPQAELLGPESFFGRRKTFILSTPTIWKLLKEKS